MAQAAKGAAGTTAQPMQWLGQGQPVLAGTAVLVALLGEEQHTPLMQPGEENLALLIVLMLPQTVITDMLPYSRSPSLLLCNLLPLQGIKNVSSSAPWLVCLSVLWEQMLRAANV